MIVSGGGVKMSKARGGGGGLSKPLKEPKPAERSSRRILAKLILQKRAAERQKKDANSSCVTRTVELLSAENIGEEKNKLLFMLALDMIPKFDSIKKNQPNLKLKLDTPDPGMVAQVKARTDNLINEIKQKRLFELKSTPANPGLPVLSPASRSISKKYAQLQQQQCHDNNHAVTSSDVELVDLVSDTESIICLSDADNNNNNLFMFEDTEDEEDLYCTEDEDLVTSEDLIDLTTSDDEEVTSSEEPYQANIPCSQPTRSKLYKPIVFLEDAAGATPGRSVLTPPTFPPPSQHQKMIANQPVHFAPRETTTPLVVSTTAKKIQQAGTSGTSRRSAGSKERSTKKVCSLAQQQPHLYEDVEEWIKSVLSSPSPPTANNGVFEDDDDDDVITLD